MTPDQLDLVPRDELMDALARRYNTVIIGLALDPTPTGRGRMVWFAGDPLTALGLTRVVEHEMLKAMDESQTIDPEQQGSGQ
jgi:hypothetical protein